MSRTRGTDDERMLHVTITDAGRRIQPHASDAQRSVEETTGLDADTLTALRDQLNDLAARTRAVPASTSRGCSSFHGAGSSRRDHLVAELSQLHGGRNALAIQNPFS